MQILPPPDDAPSAPVEMAEHPFILEFPIKGSDSWSIANFRRQRTHRQLTWLLNLLLSARATSQSTRGRHLWAIDPDDPERRVRWVQEFYSAKLGNPFQAELSAPSATPLHVVEPKVYYAEAGYDGKGLEVPADLDDLICCFFRLSKHDREKFDRAGFWMDLASRQWTMSASAYFASLVIAIEALADRPSKAAERFRDFIERYAPGESLEARRKEMYALRSDILHGTGLMQIDHEVTDWMPPVHAEHDLTRELSALARISVRNWLKERGRP